MVLQLLKHNIKKIPIITEFSYLMKTKSRMGHGNYDRQVEFHKLSLTVLKVQEFK